MAADLPLLGELPAREVWDSELDFVARWLARPVQLARLGELVGCQLAINGLEVHTANGHADMVCTDGRSGGAVVVEAQLRHGDYDHVGRLLAYCVDLDARHGVLVAEAISPALRALVAGHNRRWRAQCRLHAIELRVVGEGDDPRGAVLRAPPACAVVASAHRAPAIDLDAQASEATASRKALAVLAAGAPRRVGAAGRATGRLAGLPRAHGNARGGLTIATWPAGADHAVLARTLAHVAATDAATLLVLLEQEGAAAGQATGSGVVVRKLPAASWLLLETLLCCVGKSPVVEAQAWDWHGRGSGADRRWRVEFAHIGRDLLLRSPTVARHRARRDFWRRLGKEVQRGTATRMLTRDALASSSWQLSYALGHTGVSLVTFQRPRARRYIVEMRVFAAQGAVVDNWFAQLAEHAAAIDVALGGDFALAWHARGRLRSREAVLRCEWQGAVAPPADAGADAATLATAVLQVEGAVLSPVRKLQEFAW